MLRAGELRLRLARTLNAAYGDGLLSEATLAYRLDLLFSAPVIDPARVTGDLSFRSPGNAAGEILFRLRALARRLLNSAEPAPARLLALDWGGAQDELVIGRDPACDIVLSGMTVSRRHLRLLFTDGAWIVRDLDSTNGTRLNDSVVVRCQLRPGDRLRLGDEHLIID